MSDENEGGGSGFNGILIFILIFVVINVVLYFTTGFLLIPKK